MLEYYLIGVAILLLMGLCGAVGYNYYRTKEKVVERAKSFICNDELEILNRKINEMMAAEVRELYHLNDEDFRTAVSRILHNNQL